MRKKHKKYAALGLLALALAFLWAGQHWIGVTVCTVEGSGLPDGFRGFRVVQVSDLHGSFLTDGGARLAHAVAGERPDLIAITGDLFDRRTDREALYRAMARLAALAPVYYVTGNHEWTCDDRREVFARLGDAGVRLLGNDYVVLERGGSRLILAGAHDPNGPADMERPEALVARIRRDYPEDYLLLLYHRNTRPEQWRDLGVNTVLCGHGHGGLVRLPFVGGLAGPDRRLFPTYDAGLYHLGATNLVVSRGLGNNPGTFRVFNPPELVTVVLSG